MRHLGIIATSAAILSIGLVLGAAPQPAKAGAACDAAGLPSPCAGSSDIKPQIKLGLSGNDGDFFVKRANGKTGVRLDGDSGNVTNRFKGNGLAKAWARMNADGTIHSCWRCNKDPLQTQKLGTGAYEVDFTPLATNISARPILAEIQRVTSGTLTQGHTISVSTSDTSTVSVFLFNTANFSSQDNDFTIVIY